MYEMTMISRKIVHEMNEEKEMRKIKEVVGAETEMRSLGNKRTVTKVT